MKDMKQEQISILRKSIDSKGKFHPEELYNSLNINSISVLLQIKDIDDRIQKLMMRKNLDNNSVLNILAADKRFVRAVTPIHEFN